MPKAEYQQWLAARKAESAPQAPAAATATALDALGSSPSGTGERHVATPDPSTDPTPEASEPAGVAPQAAEPAAQGTTAPEQGADETAEPATR